MGGLQVKHYVVTLDRPYYPEIYYCGTRSAAIAIVEELVRHEDHADGIYECKITLGEIQSVKWIKTDH
jgi:hypothetical protein